ncbi:MAG: glycosyltransferase family 39 protein [Planctomycetes bacterium]|nr:glycosyltransferase family 39 protein [Planctomycetota bacterium]
MRPLVTWPPLYPALLAPSAWLGVSALEWARWLGAALFSALCAMASALAGRAAGPRAALVAGALFPLTGVMPELFSMVYSEAPFLVLQTAWLWTMWWAITRSGWRPLLFAGLVAAAITLTRYTGACCIAAGAFMLLFAGGLSRRSAGRSALFALVAIVPVACWLARNKLTGGSTVERPLELANVGPGWFVDVWRQCTLWLLPGDVSRWLRHGLLLALLAGGGAATWHWRRMWTRGPARPCTLLAALLGATVVSYFLLLAAATFLSPREPTLDLRMLAPAQLPAILLLAIGAAAAWRTLPRSRLPVAGLVTVLALAGVQRAIAFALDARRDGLALNTAAWQGSSMLTHAANLPKGCMLASNQPEIVYWHLHRPCLFLPASGADAPAYHAPDPTRLATFRAQARNGVCYVLLFRSSWPWYAEDAVLVRTLGMKPVAEFDDGTLWVIPHTP